MTNTDEIISNIFESDIQTLLALQPKEDYVTSTRSSHILKTVDKFIEVTLLSEDHDIILEENIEGRLGPRLVTFDTSAHYGYFFVSHDRLDLNAQKNFSTIRANTSVYKGKWIYELQLGTRGVMQLGWCTIHCKFNEESGVGDTIHSYAYDGNRVRKWNISTNKYGEAWVTGDIITCTLDADEGNVDFYRNGRSLGRAFENICLGSGMAYFPAVSLNLSETLKANFGNTPLRYPVEGYQPLQAPPVTKLRKAALLVKWFSKLVLQIENLKFSEEPSTFGDTSMSVQAFLMCIARSILKKLGPLLKTPYVVDATFVPFLEEQLSRDINDNKTDQPKLTLILDLIWAFFKEIEIKMCFEATAMHLLSTFKHNPVMLDYPDQCRSLLLLTSLCRHKATRQHLLQNALFQRIKFANFVHVKPLNETTLQEVVNRVWWETNPVEQNVESNKKAYMAACDKIRASTAKVEALQVELLVTLLNNSDGTNKLPSSRSIFLQKFRSFIYDNFDYNSLLQTDQIHPTPLPVTLCCFHRLLVAFKVLWDTEIGTNPVFVPCRTFYDNSIRYPGIERLGGVLSHLQKTYESDLIRLLGPDHEVLKPTEPPPEPVQNTTPILAEPSRPGETIGRQVHPLIHPAVARLINATGFPRPLFIELRLSFDKHPLPAGPADPTLSLVELLDGIILFYHVAAKKQIAKVASLREIINEYTTAIADTRSRLEQAKKIKNTDADVILQELTKSVQVFQEKLSEESRHMAWIRAFLYSHEKQMQLSWLLKTVTSTLRAASEEGNMFTFVPDFYLKVLADLYVGIRNHVHPTAPIEKIAGYEEMLRDVAHFLCDHFMDPRIVIASAKDKLTLTLCQIVSSPMTVKALESVPIESRLKMVSNLLKPYENRAWAQSNIVLVRFWRGSGFAFRYDNSPHMSKKSGPRNVPPEIQQIIKSVFPCPSLVYQMHVRDVLLNNAQATTNFLDSLLNQLNWAFSEFITMVQDIHNISFRPQRVFIESRQLKICATCFEFATSLLRVLEMIVTVAPNVLSDPVNSSGNLLPRLCQLLCQILNRMSSHTSCFQHVVQLDIPDLETIDHFPILSAVIGILLALLKQDMSISSNTEEIPFVTKALLMEPSFQISSLQYVLNDVSSSEIKSKGVKPFSFLNYKDDVSEEEIEKVRNMIEYLDKSRQRLPEINMIIDEDNMCTICYAYPTAVTFKPCNHTSCQACIERYLMISHDCFFCKATIDKVVDLSGVVLHDFTSNNSSQSTIS